jgi:alkylation response protein AidB-like acyl-CoA dehydrogenase
MGIREGIVAIAYEDVEGDEPYLARIHQFLKYHLWSGSNAIVTCPSAMSDGAARVLGSHVLHGFEDSVQGRVFRDACERLASRDVERCWTSGQWMTERSGGSDVRGTETVATYLGKEADGAVDDVGMSLGPWSVSGFKWFSSATDSNMTILLARTEKGISAFFAPMRRRNRQGEVVMNGVTIQRLKPKLGTRPLPTGELVLSDMRAWLIGKEGEGIREIATVLNITRIHTALSALGFWGRGLAISRAYAKVRKVEGRLLMDNEAHMRTMAENHVNYVGHMYLGFFTVALLGISEHPRDFEKMKLKEEESGFVKDLEQASALLRLLTPVAKAQCSKMAIKGLQECMESLGGIGYLEDEQEFNVARLFRDANVLSIWEGTTDVMASDVVRVMKGKDGENVRKQFIEWVNWKIKGWSGMWKIEELVREQLGRLEEWWIKMDVKELRFSGRQILELLAWVTATVLLIDDSRRDEGDVGKLLARQWISTLGVDVDAYTTRPSSWQEFSAWNRKIVFGDVVASVAAKL